MSVLQGQLQAVLDRYVTAYVGRDAPGCAAVFLPGGAVYSAYGPPALGRAAIAAQHQDWVAHGSGSKRLDIESCGGAGSDAWCLARFSEGEAAGEGMSLMVFERDADGAWWIRVSSLTSLA